MGLTSLTNISKIMRAKGWLNGARLMDKWFAGPPVHKPVYTTPDLSTIKMDAWALTFPRAKAVFDTMVREKVWSDDKAKREVWPTRLRSLGILNQNGACFDLSLKTVPEQHVLHVNFRQVGSGYGTTLDDMVAALGNFSIYVTPLSFDVGPESGRFRVKLNRVGFHIMDSFDFEGNQDLGYWDETTNSVSAVYLWHGTRVTNETFRTWRTANNRGGDFRVYSDVKVVTLNPSDSFLV
jgi:uncharacterized protein DUF6402